MRTSKIRSAINSKSKVTSITFTFPAPSLAEMAGYAGFDVLHLDMEHGVFDWNDVEEMCRAGELNGMTCTARIPNTETDTILRAFDRGLMGILCPHVDNAEQADRIAKAARFGPVGERSFGTSRGREYGMAGHESPDYMASFNEQVTVAAQIETANAVETIDEISWQVEGIDLIAFRLERLGAVDGLFGLSEPSRGARRRAEGSRRDTRRGGIVDGRRRGRHQSGAVAARDLGGLAGIGAGLMFRYAASLYPLMTYFHAQESTIYTSLTRYERWQECNLSSQARTRSDSKPSAT